MSISQSAVSNPISTHAPAGGATGQRRDAVVGKIDFYSRPCGRGDRSTAIIRSRCTYFYSRPCGRGDAQTAGVSAVSTYFYSRPCGRGDGRILLRIGKLENFYSRPCGRGDDQWQYVKELLWKISTHAPAGGATGDGGKAKGEPAYISTHAPAGGATLWSKCLSGSSFNFYSRPCGRGDVMALENGEKEDISTHAPAGGATSCSGGCKSSCTDFYSRPCGRGDSQMPQIVNIAIISTHAPAGGATIIAECEEQGIQFLLTPLREGRRHDQTFELASSNFYSRPCGRGDYDEIIKHWRFFDFYSRPCGRGDRRHTDWWTSCRTDFYSRPCGRGDRRKLMELEVSGYFYSRPCGRGDAN